MGWNCPECGTLFTPVGESPTYLAPNLYVRLNVCENCHAEYVTVGRHSGEAYVGLVKVA
jgi:hypothetical protein